MVSEMKIDPKLFFLYKDEKLPCGHNMKIHLEILQDLWAFRQVDATDFLLQSYQALRDKHNDGKCIEAMVNNTEPRIVSEVIDGKMRYFLENDGVRKELGVE